MFDLFRSRDKAVRYLLVALLSLVALSMVITLIPTFGFGGFGPTTNETAVAEICDQTISEQTVRRAIALQIQNQQMNPAVLNFMVPQMVDQLINEYATACQASRMGLTVSDKEVADGIKVYMPQLFQGGQFVGKEIYGEYLSRMNTTIPEFESRLRQNLLLEKLQGLVFDGLVVTPQEIEAEFKRQSEKASLRVVTFNFENVTGVNPTQAEQEEYLKRNQAMYQTPPQRNASLLIADADKMGAAIAPSEDQLKQAYEAAKNTRYKTEERVHVRHILVKTEGKSDAEKKTLRAKAEGLLKQVKGGGDFAEIAKKNSDDTGSAQTGGDLNWIARGQTVKPFEDASFALKPKEISGIVESQFGYHIIQPLERENARIKPYEEVRAELLSDYRKQQLFEKLPDTMEQARNELIKAPTQAEAIAAKYGLSFAKIEKAGGGFEYPVIGRSQEVDMALSSLSANGVSSTVQTPSNQLVIGVVREVLPARPSTLAEVGDRIRSAVKENKQREIAEKQTKEFEARLRANNNDLEKTARELKVKIVEPEAFDRTSPIKEVGPAGHFGEQPFMNPVNTVVGPFRTARTSHFFRIVSRTAGNLAELEAKRESILSFLKDRKRRERRDLFEEGLVRQLKSNGTIKVNDDVIKRIIASYQG